MRTKTHRAGWLLIAIVALTARVSAEGSDRDQAVQVEFFEKKIRPILVSHCYTCHSADTNSKGGLRVDDHNGLLRGGNTGAAIVPGDPAKSLLLKRVKLQDTKRRMPQEG